MYMPTTAFDQCDVLIVGGGLSGLTTAHKLAEKDPNLKVVILEKRHKLGGICCESELGDLGGKYVRWEHEEVWKLTEKLEVEMRKRDVNYLWREFPEWQGLKGKLAEFEILRFVRYLDALCEDYGPKRINNRRHKTMEQLLSQKLIFEQSRDFMRFIIKSIFGLTSNLVRVDEFLTVCYTCLSCSSMIDSLYEADFVPKHGWSDIIQRLVANLPESFVIFREKCVTEIIEQDYKHVVVHTHHGDNFKTNLVVIACPWQSIKLIIFTPQLWPPIMSRVKHLDAYVTTFTLRYNGAAWRKNGHSGILFDFKNYLYCYETEPCVLHGAWYHNSICETSQHPLVDITEIIARSFGDDVLLPVEHDIKVFEHQILINFPKMEANHGTIVWATTNNATKFRGFINGAIHSGIKAATTTLSIIRPNTMNFYDEIDEFEKKHSRTGILHKQFLSINIASGIRTVKILTVASVAYFVFQRYLKDVAKEILPKIFSKGSN